MPWPFRRRRRTEAQEAVQEAPAQRSTLTALNYAPIYKAQGGNMFDDFLRERDEEGLTDEMQELRPSFTGDSDQIINPEIASTVVNGLSLTKTERAVESWGLTEDSIKPWSKEPLEKKPVFETHSYFGRHVGAMHSFIGLRFTGVNDTEREIYNDDPEVARLGLARKRIVVGYGSGKTKFGWNSKGTGGGGRLMDDSEHMVTASTETPIDAARARILIAAIPKFHGRFNYNLATANCNDFAMTMSKLVGARVPAELYNHSLGPVQAAGVMKRSAGKNHGEGTEVIKRKDVGREQFVKESYPEIKTDMTPTIALFEQDMQTAIAEDGGTRSLPGIQAAADRVITKLNMANGISAMREEIVYNTNRWEAQVHESHKFELLRELEGQLTDAIETAKKVVTASGNTKHPNVNKIIWKLIITLEAYYRVVEGNMRLARMDKRTRLADEASMRRTMEASASLQGGSAPTVSAASL